MSNTPVSRRHEPGSDINALDLYVYNLAEPVLDSLNLLFFDSTAQLAPQPKDYLFPALKHAKNETRDLDLDDIEDSLPRIVQPQGPAKKEANCDNSAQENTELATVDEEDNHDDSGSEDSDDLSDENEEKEENETDFLYQRINETTFTPQIGSRGDTQDEDEDNTISYLNTRSAYMFFKSSLVPLNITNPSMQQDQKTFAIFKSLFAQSEITNPIACLRSWKESFLAHHNEGAQQKPLPESALQGDISALFMIGGGHFAGAIVTHQPKHVKKFIKQNEAESILPQSVQFIDHKSFHRYTTRRKQGGSQSAMDNSKGKANSAGSSLRRYNEQALAMDVREVIRAWKPYLKRCKSIFIKANTQANFKVIVGGDDHNNDTNTKVFKLYKSDPRIKHFPFSTARPTITELKKAWIKLTYLSITNLPKIDNKLKLAKQREKQLNSSKETGNKKNSHQAEQQKVETTPEIKQTNELIQLLKKSKAPALVSYMKKNKVSVNVNLQPESKFQWTPTLLHYAADNNLHYMVFVLLNNLKADPSITNKNNKTAWDLINDDESANKQTRYSFQKARFRLGESYCDWQKDTHMSAPGLSDDEVRDLEEKENKAQRHEMEKLVSEEKKKIEHEEILKKQSGHRLEPASAARSMDREIMMSLSEEDRKRLEREKRARAVEARLGLLKKK